MYRVHATCEAVVAASDSPTMGQQPRCRRILFELSLVYHQLHLDYRSSWRYEVYHTGSNDYSSGLLTMNNMSLSYHCMAVEFGGVVGLEILRSWYLRARHAPMLASNLAWWQI